MRRKKGSRRVSYFFFLIPVMVVFGLIISGILTSFTNQSGTLIVETVSSGRYASSVQLHPVVTVAGTTKTSPFNLTLAQGHYTVVFGPLNWYYTPSAKSVVVSGGKTQFAVGSYSPLLRVIDFTQSGFNSTQVTALNGVTPVVWINKGDTPVVFQISGAATVTLNPSQNYTTIFASTGVFYFSVKGTGFNGTVDSV